MTMPPSPVQYLILNLIVTERSGREIARKYKRDTGRTISYGTLYTTLKRMKESGWVTVREDSGEFEDGRVRHYRISSGGIRAMESGREFYRSLAGFGLGEGGTE